MTPAETIRKARKFSRLRLRELGARVGISAAHLSDIERGNRAPSIDTLSTILLALNVSGRLYAEAVGALIVRKTKLTSEECLTCVQASWEKEERQARGE